MRKNAWGRPVARTRGCHRCRTRRSCLQPGRTGKILRVTRSAKSRIARLGGPSFHEGSGSPWPGARAVKSATAARAIIMVREGMVLVHHAVSGVSFSGLIGDEVSPSSSIHRAGVVEGVLDLVFLIAGLDGGDAGGRGVVVEVSPHPLGLDRPSASPLACRACASPGKSIARRRRP